MANSKIYMEDVVENTERKFGAAKEYFPVKIINSDDSETWAMFTETELINANERAMKNKEDIPQSVWKKLFG